MGAEAIILKIDGSPVMSGGDALAALSRAAMSCPEAILVQVDSVEAAGDWFGRVKAWRASIDPAVAQPAVILHVSGEQAGAEGGRAGTDLSDLMLRGLDAGVDDVVIAARSSQELDMRVAHALRFRAMTRQLRARNTELARLNDHDDLTGLLNMRAFRPRLGKMLCGSEDEIRGTAVVMMDVDWFKLVNDRNNHLVGSDVLRSIGDVVREWAKESGFDGSGTSIMKPFVAARYGGDEFAMAFAAESSTGALLMVDRLRRMISQQVFLSHGKVVRVTASFGVSWRAPGTSVDLTRALSAADAMLYRSKEFGRNLVSVMDLRDPVDLDHVGRSHLIDRNASRDDNRLAGVDESEVLQKVG